jgi:hypothetical protein
MAYDICFETGADFIHAVVTGNNSPDNVMQYMKDVVIECNEQDCFRGLIEENLDGPKLDLSDVFRLASEGGYQHLPCLKRWLMSIH